MKSVKEKNVAVLEKRAIAEHISISRKFISKYLKGITIYGSSGYSKHK